MRSRVPPSPLARLLSIGVFAWCWNVSLALADEPADLSVTVQGNPVSGFSSQTSSDDARRPSEEATHWLDRLPSVHVRKLGGDGSFATLSIRGSASTQVGVFVAGVPLTGGADPSVDVSSLPLWPGASVHVYRSFAPAALGTTGYLGGVVNLVPPTAHAGARTEWALSDGSFNAWKGRLGDVRQVKLGNATVSLSSAAFASRADGDFAYEQIDPLEKRLVTLLRSNAQHLVLGALERATVQTAQGTFGALAYVDAKRRGLPGLVLFPTELTELATTRLVIGLDGSTQPASWGTLRGQLWYRGEHSTLTDPQGELDVTRRGSRAESSLSAWGGQIQFRKRWDTVADLALVVDARREAFEPLASREPIEITHATRLAFGLGTDLTLRPLRRLSIAASARGDLRRDEFTPGNVLSFDVVPTAHLGLSYEAHPALVLSTHAGVLERPPSFVELYGDQGALVGDANLLAERAFAADIGGAGQWHARNLGIGYEVIGYLTQARDLIAFLPQSRSTFVARNVDEALLYGAELSVSLSIPHLRHQVSYTWLGTRNESDDPISYGQPLPARPVHDLGYDFNAEWSPVTLRYSLDAVAGTTVDAAGTIELPPRFLQGLGIATALSGLGLTGFALHLDVENLFNARVAYIESPVRHGKLPLAISDFLGFPLPGRSAWLSLTYRAPVE